MKRTLLAALATLALALVCSPWAGAEVKPLKILFLGDSAGHQPMTRFRILQPALAKHGIDLVYTDKVTSLDPKILSGYDGLMIYANQTKITPAQEQALLDYVESGKAFIPIHCASACFPKSEKYIALVGAEFKSHKTGTFRVTDVAPDHPIMKGFAGFESFDETYVHDKHSEEGRTVLEVRVEGKVREPWTWVRTQGKGRVFYTAWGHDQQTWNNIGFQDLVERGIRWATNSAETKTVDTWETRKFPIPEMTPKRTDVKPFEYTDVGAKIPIYKPSKAAFSVQNTMQKPLSGDESAKYISVPKGFHAELFADETIFGPGNPLCINWDEKGRLWVALSHDYPHNIGKGEDRIVICEDTRGTGRADKVTVFADKLSIPASMTFYRGGILVYSGNPKGYSETLFLKDTDGDDKADVRQVVFGNWAENDTHGGANNMQYGLDNWIWGMQGYNNSTITLGGGKVQFNKGFYRFRLDPPADTASSQRWGGKMEFMRSTDNNTWGFGMSEEGVAFGSTANNNPSVFLPIPNRYYEAVRGWKTSTVAPRIADSPKFKPLIEHPRQVDQFGAYTAGAGHALYTARNYPQEYWNRTAFVCEPTGKLVGTFVLRREGSAFKSNNPFNLAASYDEWWSPVAAEVGPDGNVWISDFYEYIIQHNPTPKGFTTGKGAAYLTDLRESNMGRVFRIVYDGPGGEKAKNFTLAGASPEKLVATLKNSNMFWRKHAQRLLVERGKQDVLPALFALVRDPSLDEIGLNDGAIHALWTIHGLGALDGSNAEATKVAYEALQHPSAGVRRNAVQVLPRTPESVAALLKAGLIDDADAQVRLMSVLALADLPATKEAAKSIIVALGEPKNATDNWIADAATSAAANNGEYFIGALSATVPVSQKFLATVQIVAEHIARGAPGDSRTAQLMHSLADADARVIQAVIAGLSKGWPPGKRADPSKELEADLGRIAAKLDPSKRGEFIKLAARLGSTQFDADAAQTAKLLAGQVRDENLGIDKRVAAATELATHFAKDKEALQTLADQLSPRSSPELVAGILGALQQAEEPAVATLIVERLPSLTPAMRGAAYVTLLSRAPWTKALLDSSEKGDIQLSELALYQRRTLLEHPDAAIRLRTQKLLEKGGAVPSPDRVKVVDEFMPIAKEKGDPEAGKLVFKNTCAKCHVHGDIGENIGPDLTGMSVHPKDEMLINILDPSRSVEGNFRIYRLVTTNGIIASGLLASESQTAIELIDTEAKKQQFLRSDIEELTPSPKSLMPDGFEKVLSRTQLIDVLEFLAYRGKYVPLPLMKYATVTSTKGMFTDENSKTERLVFADWKTKTFDGIPFQLVDPQGDRVHNVIMLYGPQGKIPPTMPKSVTIDCGTPAKAIHMLSGVSGWGSPYGEKGTTSMIVRLHYADGKTEDHQLKNGEHFADYIGHADVPGSKFAFDLKGKQIRYLAIEPARAEKIDKIELVKGPDQSAPMVMAITVEPRE